MRHVRHNVRPLAVLVVLLAAAGARAAPEGWTTLAVGPDVARIYRDAYGTPHVFAPTNRALFEAYGWAVAEDRLFQLDLNRRAARGRLSELFGPSQLRSDRYARTVGYTGAELDAIYAAMPAEEREIYAAYGDGVNRYLSEVALVDPAKLPLEYALLGTVPEPWTIRDSIAFGAYMVRRFGEIGGAELDNLALLRYVETRYPPAAAYGIFDDLRFQEDPDAPVTVPAQGAVGRRQKAPPPGLGAQLRNPAAEPDVSADEAKALWESVGVPTRLGSYAWAISAAKSAGGVAMLYGGPQMNTAAPEVLHEVQLTGGNGFHVIGMAFAGAPAVLIGHNAHVAWTSTTATGDNLDVYAETLCDAGAGAGSGYEFRGPCVPFEARTETIQVRGVGPVPYQVLRSVHGPVVASTATVAYAEKRAHWMRELETGSAFFGFDRARNLNEFEAAALQVVTSHNFLYADVRGNIAYWQAGQVPVRPAGFDTRLPLPGDGSAEWTGALVPVPRSVNPAKGWLANWNNKPEANYPAADEQTFGKQGRLLEIEERLATGMVSLADMRDIPKDIARTKGLGREARFLRPWLLRAVADVPPSHPSADAARRVVEAWSGNAFARAVPRPAHPEDMTLEAGEVIFTAWLDAARKAVFEGELGTRWGEASSNVLLHVLDFAYTGTSGVPPSRDFLGGDPSVILSGAFDAVVAGLAAAQGPDPSAWTAARPTTALDHPLLGTMGTFPASNRATYAQIVVLDAPGLTAESVFTLGQSGFVSPVSGPDPHFDDQLPLYTAFEYKPQVLYRNVTLKR